MDTHSSILTKLIRYIVLGVNYQSACCPFKACRHFWAFYVYIWICYIWICFELIFNGIKCDRVQASCRKGRLYILAFGYDWCNTLTSQNIRDEYILPFVRLKQLKKGIAFFCNPLFPELSTSLFHVFVGQMNCAAHLYDVDIFSE